MATFPLLVELDELPDGLPYAMDTALPSFDVRSLFGGGLTVPFHRTGASDFAAGREEALVRSAMAQVLGTRADDGRVSGELPWRPEFGSLLHRLQYMNVDEVFAALVRTRVIGAISQWEPRCRIRDVRVARMHNGRGELMTVVDVSYDLVQTGTDNVLQRNQQLLMPLGG